MKSITITLPMPVRNHSPNARCHWSAKARAVKYQRNLAAWLVREALGRRKPPLWPAVEVLVEVTPPNRIRRDKDNLLASLKGAFDGATSAGIAKDDDVFTYLPVQILEPDKDKAGVRITFTSK
jgi:Holliday junction resolvase RusA-like endonuclease